MLFMVWVGACWPFVCVMGVAVGVFGVWWRVFQCRVAVVSASRRVPGVGVCVSWLVPGACSGVAGLVCVSWFRMLTCLGLFPVFWLLSFVCLVNNAAWGGLGWFGVCCFGWQVARVVASSGWVSCVVCVFGFVWLLGCCFVLLVCALVRVCVW